MSNVNTLLTKRLQKGEGSAKMTVMAQQSASGHLTSFSGIFSVSDLNEKEKGLIEEILKNYNLHDKDFSTDLGSLISITSEVKAITNQAVLLHGERIKKAQQILIRYRDGAFTAWLTTVYGNRQTPYNFLQYYEFYESLPKTLRPMIETMPRQAIYTLASREGPLEKKQEIVEKYQGETKSELLIKIRDTFPIEAKDKRTKNLGDGLIQTLIHTMSQLQSITLTKNQKQVILDLLRNFQSYVEKMHI